jgi:hypothetical protein
MRHLYGKRSLICGQELPLLQALRQRRRHVWRL